MKKQIRILQAALIMLITLCAAHGFGGLNPWNMKYGLSDEQAKVVYECIMEGKEQVKALNRAGRAKEAAELDAVLKNLEGRKYSLTNNPLGAVKGAYAHVYSGLGLQTIHLYKKFFELSSSPDRVLTPDMTAERARRIGRQEQLSLLIHEFWHTQYKSAWDFGRPDEEAYQLQYKWLRLFGVSDGMVLSVVKDQLSKKGVTPVEPPPVVKPPQPPPAKPGTADSKNNDAHICASFMSALQRDVAAKKHPGTKYRLEFTRPYSYDTKAGGCVGSHRIWATYQGGKEYESLQYFTPEKPAHISVSQLRSQYKTKYPDLKW